MGDGVSGCWTLTDEELRRPGYQHVILLLLLTVTGTLLGCLGDFSLDAVGGGAINIFWPASALIAVGGIWFGGWGILAGVLVGWLSGTVNAYLSGGNPDLFHALLYAPSDFVQGLVPALVFRLRKLDPSLPTRRDVGAFLLWGVLLNRILGGVLALVSLRLSGQVAGFSESLETFALWLLAGIWPGLLFGVPLLRSLSSVLPSSSLFCKTWWGGSIPPRRGSLRGEDIPVALRLFFTFALVSLLPILVAGFADIAFSPAEGGQIHDAILPVTLNLAFFLALIGVGRNAGAMNRRMGVLEAGTRALGAGNLEHRIPDLGGDELGRLGTAFNSMARDLAASREELARSVAERARDLKEKEIAWEIQRGFLPGSCPEIAGYEFAGQCVPARTVGGDFYDFVPLSGGRWGLVVADVSGKGVPAALFTGLAKNLLRVYAQGGAEPASALASVNGQLAAQNPAGMFVTLVFAELDPATGHLRYVNAGHNAPLQIRGGSVVHELKSTGLPLGLLPEAAYRTSELTLSEGDALVLFTDGVTEAFGPDEELFGDERLAGVFGTTAGGTAAEILETVRESVETFRAGTPPSDDMTVVVVRRRAPRTGDGKGGRRPGGTLYAVPEGG